MSECKLTGRVDDHDYREGKELTKAINEYNDGKILILDVETTGFKGARIVQMAWQFYTAHGNLISEYSSLIKPDGWEIDEGAFKIHGITKERCEKEGRPIDEVIFEFMEMHHLAEVLVGHNFGFDNRMVWKEMELIRNDWQIVGKPSFCTMRSTKNICKLPNKNGRAGYKVPSLKELYFFLFGKEMGNAHDALGDVKATAECLFELIRLNHIILDIE